MSCDDLTNRTSTDNGNSISNRTNTTVDPVTEFWRSANGCITRKITCICRKMEALFWLLKSLIPNTKCLRIITAPIDSGQ